MPAFSESYWVGHLSMTLAEATRSPDPQPILKAGLRDFLKSNPPPVLADMLRSTLKEKR